MDLKLKKPLVFFDLETTGTNVTTDRIVQISYIKVMPNGEEKEGNYYVNPEMHIPEEATAVHHITDEDVADKPTFKQLAKTLANEFIGCDFAGFNSNRFDVPLLIEEMIRAEVNLDFRKATSSTYRISSTRRSSVRSLLHISSTAERISKTLTAQMLTLAQLTKY